MASELRNRVQALEARLKALEYSDESRREAESSELRSRLEKSEALLNQAAAVSGLGAWEWDFRTDEFLFSKEWLRIHGCSSKRLGREELTKLAHPDDLERIVAHMLDALEGRRPYNLRHRIVRANDGEERLIDVRAVVVQDLAGTPSKMYGAVHDITEQVRTQEALEEALQSKHELLAIVSHELRTPLNGIVGISQLLQDTCLSAEQSEYVDALLHSAHSLNQLIDDVLLLAREDSHKLPLRIGPVALRSLIQSVSLQLAPMARKRNVALHTECHFEPSLEAVSDEGRVRQVIVNLIGNALKFTPKGGSVTVRCSVVEEGGGEVFACEVTDTGAGIPAEEQERIFDFFSQGSAGTKAGGSGLGLAISRQLARALGGDVVLEGETGAGSTFRFTIPVRSERRC